MTSRFNSPGSDTLSPRPSPLSVLIRVGPTERNFVIEKIVGDHYLQKFSGKKYDKVPY